MIAQHLTEFIVGGMLLLFGAAIRAWSYNTMTSLERLVARMEFISAELHEHKLDDAKMWSRIDAEVHNIYRRVDRELEQRGST